MIRGRRRATPNRKKRIGRFTVFGVIVLSLVLCATLAYKRSELKGQEKEYSRQIAELEKEKKEAEKRVEELKEYKEYVKTDEYIEEVAREKLGLVYKDEIIFEPDSDN